MITIHTQSRYKINKSRIKQLMDHLFVQYSIPVEYGINCVFVGKNKMKQIASKYKKEKVALPVLTFSYKNDIHTTDPLLGEIFLCYPQIVLLAAQRNKKVEDMIDAMIKHGVENLLKG